MESENNFYYLSAFQGFDTTQAGAPLFQDLKNQEVKSQVTAAKSEWEHLARTRSRLWKEEQTLLIDSSRYIRPIETRTIPDPHSFQTSLVLPSIPAAGISGDWLAGILLLFLILAATIRHNFGRYLSVLFQSTVNYSASSRLYREQNVSLKQGSVLLEFFFLVTMGLFGYQLIRYLEMEFPVTGFYLFLVCFAALFLYFLLKEFLYRLLGFISETRSETSEYLFTMKNHNKVTGLLLFPVVTLATWAPVANPSGFLLTGVIIIALLYLKSLQRGMKIMLKKQFSLFYLFLYLCTVEILPLLLFFKAI